MALLPHYDDLECVLGPEASVQTTDVRSEYERVVPYLAKLAQAFGVDFSVESRLNIASLMRAMEVVDRHFDSIPDFQQAEHFLHQVLQFLISGMGVRPIQPIQLPEEVVRHLTPLRDILIQQGVLHSFVRLVEEASLLSLEMRMMQSVREYIDATLHEGELMCDLLFLVLREDEMSHELCYFFRRGAAFANLVDNYVDMRDDYKQGRMSISPSFALRSTLLAVLAQKVTYLIALYPQKSDVPKGIAKVFRLLDV